MIVLIKSSVIHNRITNDLSNCNITMGCGVDSDVLDIMNIPFNNDYINTHKNICFCGVTMITNTGHLFDNYNLIGISGNDNNPPEVNINILPNDDNNTYIMRISSSSLVNNIKFQIDNTNGANLFYVFGSSIYDFVLDKNSPQLSNDIINYVNDRVSDGDNVNIAHNITFSHNYFNFTDAQILNLNFLMCNDVLINLNVNHNVFNSYNSEIVCQYIDVKYSFNSSISDTLNIASLESNIFINNYMLFNDYFPPMNDSNVWLGNCNPQNQSFVNKIKTISNNYRNLFPLRNNQIHCVLCSSNYTNEMIAKCDYQYDNLEDMIKYKIDKNVKNIDYYGGAINRNIFFKSGDVILIHGVCKVCNFRLQTNEVSIFPLHKYSFPLIIGTCGNEESNGCRLSNITIKIDVPGDSKNVDIRVSGLNFTFENNITNGDSLFINSSHPILTNNVNINVNANIFDRSKNALRLLLNPNSNNNNVKVTYNGFTNNNVSVIVNFRASDEYTTLHFNNTLMISHNTIFFPNNGIRIFTSDYHSYSSYTDCTQEFTCDRYTLYNTTIANNFIFTKRNSLLITLLDSCYIHDNVVIITSKLEREAINPISIVSLFISNSVIVNNFIAIERGFNDNSNNIDYNEVLFELSGSNTTLTINTFDGNINILLGYSKIYNTLPVYCSNCYNTSIINGTNVVKNGAYINKKSQVTDAELSEPTGDVVNATTCNSPTFRRNETFFNYERYKQYDPMIWVFEILTTIVNFEIGDVIYLEQQYEASQTQSIINLECTVNMKTDRILNENIYSKLLLTCNQSSICLFTNRMAIDNTPINNDMSIEDVTFDFIKGYEGFSKRLNNEKQMLLFISNFLITNYTYIDVIHHNNHNNMSIYITIPDYIRTQEDKTLIKYDILNGTMSMWRCIDNLSKKDLSIYEMDCMMMSSQHANVVVNVMNELILMYCDTIHNGSGLLKCDVKSKYNYPFPITNLSFLGNIVFLSDSNKIKMGVNNDINEIECNHVESNNFYCQIKVGKILNVKTNDYYIYSNNKYMRYFDGHDITTYIENNCNIDYSGKSQLVIKNGNCKYHNNKGIIITSHQSKFHVIYNLYESNNIDGVFNKKCEIIEENVYLKNKYCFSLLKFMQEKNLKYKTLVTSTNIPCYTLIGDYYLCEGKFDKNSNVFVDDAIKSKNLEMRYVSELGADSLFLVVQNLPSPLPLPFKNTTITTQVATLTKTSSLPIKNSDSINRMNKLREKWYQNERLKYKN